VTASVHPVGGRSAAGAEALIAVARHRQRRRRIRFAIALALVVCAGWLGYRIGNGAARPASVRATGTSVLPNPCLLLTDAAAGAVLGTRIEYRTAELPSAVRSAPSRFRMCTWTGVPLGNFTSYHFSAVLMLARITLHRFKTTEREEGLSAVPVHGLGQFAYANTGAAHFLMVFDRGYSLTIQAAAANPIAAAEALARLALERLPS
jgi:hypothetical protein